MADDHAELDAQRAAIRDRYRAEQARLAAISDDAWAARRDDEVQLVRKVAAERRRSAA
jgi:hypothetical protein